MKNINGITVYEESDACALDEYSEQLAKDLQEKFKENKYDDKEIRQSILDIQTKNKKQDTSIETLQKENIELKAENERLREDLNSLPSIPGEGENVTLKGTANARFKKFGIGGNSWQETRSGKNLFNASLIANTNIQVNDNGKTIIMPVITSGNGITNTNKKLSELCPNLKVGDEVYLFLETTSSKNIYIHFNVSAYTWSRNTLRTITQDDLDSDVYLYGNRYQGGETDQVTISNFMITKVNDNTWEQYGAMPSTEFESPIQNVTGNANFTICNKNLFDSKAIPNFSEDSSGVNLTVDNEGIITILNNTNPSGYTNTTKTLKELSSALKVGDVAYLYLETTHTIKYIWLNGTNEIWNNGASKTITKEMLDGRISIYGGNTQTDTLKIQVTLNEPSSKYTPCQSQSFTFPLAEGQKLMLNDYLADDGIHHKRGQVVLDGTETVIKTTSTDYADNPYFIIKINNIKALKSPMCNYLVGRNITSNTQESVQCLNDAIFLQPSNGILSIEDFKTWVEERYANGKPVTIECELDEEEIEPYTEGQQAVHNEIKKTAKSYGDVTHIFSTDETSPIFDVEARIDMNTLVTRIERLESEV